MSTQQDKSRRASCCGSTGLAQGLQPGQGSYTFYAKWTRQMSQVLTLKNNVFKVIPLNFPEELEYVHDIYSVLALWPAQTRMHANCRSPSSAWCQVPPWPHVPAPSRTAAVPQQPCLHWIFVGSRLQGGTGSASFPRHKSPCWEYARSPAQVLELIQSNPAMHTVIGLSRLFCQV